MFYKPITIVNDNSRVINKLETSLTDDARVIIYNLLMFIVQATRHREGFKLLGAMTKIRIAHTQKINFEFHSNFMFSNL